MCIIKVNGKSKHVALSHISYEQAVAIANGDRPNPWAGLHTVTYRYKEQDPGGELAPGETTPVKADMMISCHVTDRS